MIWYQMVCAPLFNGVENQYLLLQNEIKTILIETFGLISLQFRKYFAPVLSWSVIWRGLIGIAIIDFSDDDNFSINIGSEYFLVNNLHRELGKLELGRQTRQWPLLWPVISRFIFLFSSAQLDEILSILKKNPFLLLSIYTS